MIISTDLSLTLCYRCQNLICEDITDKKCWIYCKVKCRSWYEQNTFPVPLIAYSNSLDDCDCDDFIEDNQYDIFGDLESHYSRDPE